MPKLDFPDEANQPYHVREIFNYMKAVLPKEDILAFHQGTLYTEGLINVYLRILEKANLVLQSQYNF